MKKNEKITDPYTLCIYYEHVYNSVSNFYIQVGGVGDWRLVLFKQLLRQFILFTPIFFYLKTYFIIITITYKFYKWKQTPNPRELIPNPC